MWRSLQLSVNGTDRNRASPRLLAMQEKYNFIVKEVLELQEGKVLSKRFESKVRHLRDTSMERGGGEGTVGFYQTVQDVREHISRCAVSFVLFQPPIPLTFFLKISVPFPPSGPRPFPQAFMHPPWECIASSYSSQKSLFNLLHLLACWGKRKGRRRGKWLGLTAYSKEVRLQWSNIQGFLLPLLSLVISWMVLQKRFITCSRDLVVLYISLPPPPALLHTSP